ncbi:unnamed protein product, partial [Polarella glacialis]
VGAPTLTFCSSLLNQHTSPSGLQLSVISLGGNFGASFCPFMVGGLMQRYGPLALPWFVCVANGIVLVGMFIASVFGLGLRSSSQVVFPKEAKAPSPSPSISSLDVLYHEPLLKSDCSQCSFHRDRKP